MTPLDIITMAMRRARVLGVGQSVSADDADTAFRELNVMMAQWAFERYLVYTLVDLAKICTGAQSYTVGPGGDYDTPLRPDVIDAAFVRQFPTAPIVISGPAVTVPLTASPMYYQAPEAGTITVTGSATLQFSDASGSSSWVAATSPVTMDVDDGLLITYTGTPVVTFTPSATTTRPAPVATASVDYPLTIYYSREDYNRVSVKGLSSFPFMLFYDPQFPLGNAYPYPYPDGSGLYELHLTVKQPIEKFISLAETVMLPEIYEGALVSNMAVTLRRVIAGLPTDPSLNAEADYAKQLIRGTSTQLPRMSLPRALARKRGVYNIYADRSR